MDEFQRERGQRFCFQIKKISTPLESEEKRSQFTGLDFRTEFRIVKNLKLLLDGYGGFSSTPLQLELGGIWEGYTVKEIKGRVVGSIPVHLIEPVK
ncbi:hypothetical protein PIB30_081365, partial [Stylosanthes scabra]|nr:hypothetical protein [Stylosanthes scabra]